MYDKSGMTKAGNITSPKLNDTTRSEHVFWKGEHRLVEAFSIPVPLRREHSQIY